MAKYFAQASDSVRVGLVALSIVVLVVGCSHPAAQAPAPGTTVTVDGTVVDNAGKPVGGAAVSVTSPSHQVAGATTGASGHFSVQAPKAAACVLHVGQAGFADVAQTIDCTHDRTVQVRLRAVEVVPPTTSQTSQDFTTDSGPAPGDVTLSGLVMDATSGNALAATVRLLAAQEPQSVPVEATTDAIGHYRISVPSGTFRLSVSSGCHADATLDVDLESDKVLDVRLERAGGTTLPAPTSLRATAGPGPGMTTVDWQPASAVAPVGYRVYAEGGVAPVMAVANTLAYGFHSPLANGRFQVTAVDACGFESARSAAVGAPPLPGSMVGATASGTSAATVSTEHYPVTDATGQALPEAAWRVVLGTGNCCENYVSTTQDGRILDLGGQDVFVSGDLGASWKAVRVPVDITGEGAITTAPDGDIVGVSWVTYGGDTLVAFKYSKASNAWYTSVIPHHTPFWDRPWISVVKGPFEVNGLVVPYITLAMGGVGLKDPFFVSLDGVNYVAYSQSQLLLSTTILPALDLAADADRDWLQFTGPALTTALDHGLAVRYGTSEVTTDGLTWESLQMGASVPQGQLQADGQGGLHVVSAASRSFSYSWSHDGGRSWDKMTIPTGADIGVWDFRASATFDEVVIAAQLRGPGDKDHFKLYRITGATGTPSLTEILDMGNGDDQFRGDVTGGGNRFDFMTLGFLPGGKVVASFGDKSTKGAPALAIEL